MKKREAAAKSRVSPAANPRSKPAAHLRACPFCRELFVEGEGETCPECGIELRDIAALPPSPEAEALGHEEAPAQHLAPTIPQTEQLPWTDLSRGRGILLVCALVGLGAFFFLPWAQQTMPYDETFSGYEMAKKQSFFWMAFTAWLVLFPSVASRRTLLKMVGARVAVVTLSLMPLLSCLFLLTKPTHFVRRGLPYEYHWGPGFWTTLAVSIVATLVAFRFGGRLDDVKVRTGSSAGEVLH